MKILIKRYPNRKLYNTNEKQYISLGQIAGLIRAGGEIQVIQHATGEDITALILSQIIMKSERNSRGSLSRSVLLDLIQSGGLTFDLIRHSVEESFDLLSNIDDEIKRRLEMLVSRGEIPIHLAEGLIKKLVSIEQKDFVVPFTLENHLRRVILGRSLVTKNDLMLLQEQVEALSKALDQKLSNTCNQEKSS